MEDGASNCIRLVEKGVMAGVFYQHKTGIWNFPLHELDLIHGDRTVGLTSDQQYGSQYIGQPILQIRIHRLHERLSHDPIESPIIGR